MQFALYLLRVSAPKESPTLSRVNRRLRCGTRKIGLSYLMSDGDYDHVATFFLPLVPPGFSQCMSFHQMSSACSVLRGPFSAVAPRGA